MSSNIARLVVLCSVYGHLLIMESLNPIKCTGQLLTEGISTLNHSKTHLSSMN